jgi:hypothetical protein
MSNCRADTGPGLIRAVRYVSALPRTDPRRPEVFSSGGLGLASRAGPVDGLGAAGRVPARVGLPVLLPARSPGGGPVAPLPPSPATSHQAHGLTRALLPAVFPSRRRPAFRGRRSRLSAYRAPAAQPGAGMVAEPARGVEGVVFGTTLNSGRTLPGRDELTGLAPGLSCRE